MYKSSTFKFASIKKLLYTSIFLFLLLGVNNSFAANRYSVATGNWNSTSTWSAISGGASGATVPVAGDLVTVEGGFIVTVNANTASLGSLTISSGSSLNVSSNFTVSSTTITINGTYINNSTGTITGTISVNASGTYQHNINGGTIPTATWDPASTCNVTGITSTTPTGFNQSFGNFIWNSNSSDIVSTDGDMIVQGNFTLSQGIFALSNGLTRNLFIAGNYIQTGGIFDFNRAGTTNLNKMYIAGDLTNTLATTPTNGSITTLGAGAQNGEIIFNGSGIQTVNFTKTDAAQWISYTIDASSNIKLASSIQLIGDNSSSIYYANFTVNGILDAGNFSISYLSGGTGATLFTLSSGATLITANTGGIDGSIPTSNMTRTFSAGANYTYDGTSAQVTGASLTQNNPRGVTISNSAGVTFSAQTYMDYLDISSGSIVNLGTFTGHTASVLYLSGTAYNTGSWGSSSSAATNKADTCFAATVGYLTLTPVTQSYTTTTDIVIPCGVTSITVAAWGGGGQGGTRNSNGTGGGGGGGAYAKGDVTVVSGNTYTVTVGGGGTSQNGSQIPGGDSYFGDGTTVKAKGGNSVPYNTSTGATGGSSSSNIGTIKYSGGNGANGSGTYGGGGGSSAGTALDGNSTTNATGATAPTGGGNGGNGRSSSNGNGSPGTPPGGGGGGAYRTSGTRNGGAGGNGLVNITYPTIIPTITLGSYPSVCQGSSIANLTYTATTGCPNQYIISFDATAKTAGFLNVDPTTLPSSPITISVPTGVTPATYNASLTVINSNGFHSSVYAITITVTANNWTGAVSTAWESSGNWCGGVPSSNTDVTIPLASNQPIIGPSITALCNNITISSGATVTIAAGTSPGSAGGLLTIGRTLTNNAGASGIVVKSSSSGPNGSLIFSQPGLNSSVQATIEMYSKAYAANSNPYSAYKWQFFGIPLHSMSPSPTFDGSYVRKYDESGTTSATRWVNQTNGSTLTSFDGYEITQPLAKTITFNGVLEVGNLSR
ncbi:MAG: hypothetical protein PHS84_04275, partial [Paludibacter sp.]|nr:hypothetical protein [Paludibacter sp.]